MINCNFIITLSPSNKPLLQSLHLLCPKTNRKPNIILSKWSINRWNFNQLHTRNLLTEVLQSHSFKYGEKTGRKPRSYPVVKNKSFEVIWEFYVFSKPNVVSQINHHWNPVGRYAGILFADFPRLRSFHLS